jgi:hypothetical protein
MIMIKVPVQEEAPNLIKISSPVALILKPWNKRKLNFVPAI